MCNAAVQRLDDQRVVIVDLESVVEQAANAENDAVSALAVSEENAQTARLRILADYNRPDQYYANIFAIRPPLFLEG